MDNTSPKYENDPLGIAVSGVSDKLLEVLKTTSIQTGLLALSECMVVGANISSICSSVEEEKEVVARGLAVGSTLLNHCLDNGVPTPEIIIAAATLCSLLVLGYSSTVQNAVVN